MAPLKVLIGCETSGVVRRAFLERGHDAYSCDLLPAEDRSNRHIQCDIRELLDERWGWDLLAVLHPTCTRLCNSGVRWLKAPPPHRTVDDMQRELREGAALYSACWNAPIERIAVENPVMHRYAKALIVNWQRQAQFVQPWWFGDPAFKATGLNLKNLPLLKPTNRLIPPPKGTAEHKAWSVVHRASPGADRWKRRSRTFPGLADAMADQWGGVVDQSHSRWSA